MPIEFEAKFIDIDVQSMRNKLKQNDAKLIHKPVKFFRSVFSLCDNSVKGYARIRQEKDSCTMTVKLYKNEKYPEEYEVSINESFETGFKFLEALGIECKAYHESFRERWNHPLAHEITFDTLPGLPTYMEVDCTSEKNLNDLIKILDLDKSKMRFGAYDKTYFEYYGIEPNVINDGTPSITFKNILNEINPTKNKDLLEEISEEQQKFTNEMPEETKIFKKIISRSIRNNPTYKPKRSSKKTSKKSSKRGSKLKRTSKSKKTSKRGSKSKRTSKSKRS